MGSSIYHTLGIGAESLYNSRQGVDTAGHNIANAQVEGYSRQRVNLTTRDPSDTRGIIIGNGSYVKNITRAHDAFVEKQLNLSSGDNGRSSAKFEELTTVEDIFNPELQSSVSDQLDQFYSSLQELSNYPEELTVRSQVVESAKNLAISFQRVDNSLRSQQQDLNFKIKSEVQEINGIIERIAKLNIDIGGVEAGPGEVIANDLRDQQDMLLRDLSTKMDISYYNDGKGQLCVRGPKQATLVEGGVSNVLGVRSESSDYANKFEIVVSDPEEKTVRRISDGLTTGKLTALYDVRDNFIDSLIENNNKMAASLAREFNSIHAEGFGLGDFKESIGRNFFNDVTDLKFAAQQFSVADHILENTDAISAAASPNAPGDNVIVNRLSRLKNMEIVDGNNLNEYYANYVGVLGLEIVRSERAKEASEVVTAELNSRREAVSGVSLDEEATNLLKWQTAFTASSKLITTADEMLQTILGLKR